MAAPENTSPETAIKITSLPFTITQDVSEVPPDYDHMPEYIGGDRWDNSVWFTMTTKSSRGLIVAQGKEILEETTFFDVMSGVTLVNGTWFVSISDVYPLDVCTVSGGIAITIETTDTGPTSFTNTSPIVIEDNYVQVGVDVSGMVGSITSIQVAFLGLTHSRPSELVIWIQSPEGYTYPWYQYGKFFPLIDFETTVDAPVDNINLVFDSESNTDISLPLTSGNFQPLVQKMLYYGQTPEPQITYRPRINVWEVVPESDPEELIFREFRSFRDRAFIPVRNGVKYYVQVFNDYRDKTPNVPLVLNVDRISIPRGSWAQVSDYGVGRIEITGPNFLSSVLAFYEEEVYGNLFYHYNPGYEIARLKSGHFATLATDQD